MDFLQVYFQNDFLQLLFMILLKLLYHLNPNFSLMCLEAFKSGQSPLFFNLFLLVDQSGQIPSIFVRYLTMKKLLEILKLFHFKFIFSCLTLSLQIIYLFLFFFDYLFSLVIFTPIHLLISSWHLLSMCYPMFLFFSANFLLSEFIEM